jgi:hypothetical protein
MCKKKKAMASFQTNFMEDLGRATNSQRNSFPQTSMYKNVTGTSFLQNLGLIYRTA